MREDVRKEKACVLHVSPACRDQYREQANKQKWQPERTCAALARIRAWQAHEQGGRYTGALFRFRARFKIVFSKIQKCGILHSNNGKFIL